jgi:hypothetical protein
LVPAGTEEIMDDDTSASVVGLDFRVLNSEKQNENFQLSTYSNSIHIPTLLAMFYIFFVPSLHEQPDFL